MDLHYFGFSRFSDQFGCKFARKIDGERALQVNGESPHLQQQTFKRNPLCSSVRHAHKIIKHTQRNLHTATITRHQQLHPTVAPRLPTQAARRHPPPCPTRPIPRAAPSTATCEHEVQANLAL